jgi:hypothetical protein
VLKKSLDSCFYEIIPKLLPPEVEILTKWVPFQYFVCLHKSAVLLHEQLENRENPSLWIPHHTMRQTRCTQNRPVNIVNEYANEPAY